MAGEWRPWDWVLARAGRQGQGQLHLQQMTGKRAELSCWKPKVWNGGPGRPDPEGIKVGVFLGWGGGCGHHPGCLKK